MTAPLPLVCAVSGAPVHNYRSIRAWQCPLQSDFQLLNIDRLAPYPALLTRATAYCLFHSVQISTLCPPYDHHNRMD
ncbi:hypothetical protein EVA_14336 [gut metagenome]|uniref:Uncharacterized protein n=1 Tax=gut metagenome TaxID=749906 RepID=J9G724_9ZZZZ